MPSTVPVVARLQVSGLVTLESGRHYNIFVGSDVERSTATRTPIVRASIGRNSYEGPGYASVDLRIGREFAVGGRARLDVSVDFFNLFNRVNVKDVNTVWGGIDINVPAGGAVRLRHAARRVQSVPDADRREAEVLSREGTKMLETKQRSQPGQRRRFVHVGFFFVFSVSLVASFQTSSFAPPNIVIVLVDDMGWSDIAPYGGEIPTPHLDALARGGVRFTQFYATPRCSPTRASLLTGLYPHQAGMGHLDNIITPGSSGTTGRLNDRSVTIAEVLRAAGYFTAMAGKWHLGQLNGSPPWERGFDRVLNLRAGGMFFPNQNFQGGGELTARGQEPLYLDGRPIPRDSPRSGRTGTPRFSGRTSG